MISVVAMTQKVRDRLTKDRRTIKRLKGQLEVARCANAKLRQRVRVAQAQERESARQLREFRKKQMKLPLAIVARVKAETVTPTSGCADAALALDQVAAELRA